LLHSVDNPPCGEYFFMKARQLIQNGDEPMKSLSVLAAGLCSLAFLAWIPLAQAGGAKGMRADLPCPYGGAGGVNADLWSPTSGTSPFNPGLLTPNTATLVAGSTALENGDQNQLAVTSAIQYVYYSSPIPDASNCSADPFSVNPDGPLEQVLSYTMGDSAVAQAGDIEVAFNYNTAAVPALATTLGTASFTFGGVTYASSGTLLPTSTDNDFLFSSAGALIGEIVTATNGTASVIAGVPQGWTIKTGGGGGTMSAPEIDPASSFAAVTLLAGLLAVMRGGRRTLRVSH
jgi:hypothetical protein